MLSTVSSIGNVFRLNLVGEDDDDDEKRYTMKHFIMLPYMDIILP